MTRLPDGTVEPTFPSTPFREKVAKITSPRSGQRRRQAAPHPSAKRTGRKTPVTVTLTWRGGSEGWVEIRSAQGMWRRPYTHCIGALVEELVQGGHWVEDVPGRREVAEAVEARRARRRL